MISTLTPIRSIRLDVSGPNLVDSCRVTSDILFSISVANLHMITGWSTNGSGNPVTVRIIEIRQRDFENRSDHKKY